MKASKRLSTLLPYGDDGWDLYRKALARQNAGLPVTMLTIGEHDIGTAPAILDAMDAAARKGLTGYAPVPGQDALRACVAKRIERQTGAATSAENVLIVPGGQAGLFASHIATLDPGDIALFIDPYYATYPGTIRGAGGLPRVIVTGPETRFLPSRDALAEAAPGARTLLINTPNNPTGQIYDRATLEGIAETCMTHDLWLICDEVYDTQVWSGTHLSPRALPGMAERTLVVGSMSKSHAMTGSRIGWVVGPAEIIAHMADLATHTTYGVPGFVQAAALWALEQGPGLEEDVSAPFRRRRALAEIALAGNNRIRALPSDATMYLLLDIRPTGMSGTAFAEALLDAEGIAVMPGESFGRAAAGHVRVAMTIDDDAFAEALARLARFAETCPSGARSGFEMV
ncbi:pyridoxal phosphate-dependent aminotransferase [Aliiruegeria sabulilitoris]|uniref:pyridoxal phosphate-dependent aminotransferase n=1 Tax=Aliiruegeria sabulilitoris TaxID=1510458 RepID=UPI000833C3AE|nr:pyridoxal phosphate-dependent aminotransferase [Aliiruegeria sabulilitoris]NDR55010.1 pyridoxal phosphate-dependent aminotransferase [Pseudoruegeria sp. M32A2M]